MSTTSDALPSREAPEADQPLTYPGAQRPDRRRFVDAGGVAIATYEWGAADAPPIFCIHGGFDMAATWDLIAPILAASGWRVVAWDQRGHGDSEQPALHSWDADMRDAIAVMDTVTIGPAPLVGHSKGGGLALQMAESAPHRFSHIINLDGLPSRRPVKDLAEHDRTRMLAADLTAWLDHRRATASAERKAGSLDELARRRGRMNPRLPAAWLQYLVSIGARHDADGWRWKLDPSMRFGGFGPWRPEWSMLRLPGLGMPFLGVLGLAIEEMSWGTTPDDVLPYLPPGARFEPLADTGHFVHIEQPAQVAGMILDLIGTAADAPRARPAVYVSAHADVPISPASGVSTERTPTLRLRHNRVDLALHELRPGTGRPLLLLHGLGERTTTAPAAADAWPGPVWGLDFTGHGASTVPVGSGYTSELLMADADVALAHLGPCTVLGRGVGAYAALMLAGARPELVRGAVLTDGPGLAGGATGPTSGSIVPHQPYTGLAPDPWAIIELARDLRPADYAVQFVRQAVQLSGLANPISVHTLWKPRWLQAVLDDPSTTVASVKDALAIYAKVT